MEVCSRLQNIIILNGPKTDNYLCRWLDAEETNPWVEMNRSDSNDQFSVLWKGYWVYMGFPCWSRGYYSTFYMNPLIILLQVHIWSLSSFKKFYKVIPNDPCSVLYTALFNSFPFNCWLDLSIHWNDGCHFQD